MNEEGPRSLHREPDDVRGEMFDVADREWERTKRFRWLRFWPLSMLWPPPASPSTGEREGDRPK